MMNQTTIEGLITLLQTTLGGVSKRIANEVDLKQVYKLARQQEVVAIALDGLQKLQRKQPHLASSPTLQAVKLQWIGSLMAQEKHYQSNLMAAQELSALYADNEMLTYVLKGLSISQLYPVPSHRFSCDLDCFLLSQEGKFDAYELGNALVATRGIKVDDTYYKHSVFAYKGLMVENHRFCCSVKRSERTRQLEGYLRSLLKGYTPDYIEDTRLALPPQLFQALFMIEHANGHFLYSKMNLKQVCDWAMMRKAFHYTLDWAEFDRQCQRFGLTNFVVCMNHLADYVLGQCTYDDLRAIDKRVLNDMFTPIHLPSSPMKQRIEKAWGVLRSSWKFKHFCADSMIKELTHSVWAYLRVDNPELD